jgi:hypothetical protein
MGWFGKLAKGVISGAPLIGAAADAISQHSANKANKKIAREQMAFQERMSSTEMQRRVSDLQAAGLNPMLAGMNQQGASSAQGASTRVEPITRNSAGTALAIQTQRANLENIGEQTRLLRAQQANVREDTVLKASSAHNLNTSSTQLEYQSMALAQDIKRKVLELDITEEQIKQARLNTSQLERLQPLLLEYQRLVNQAEQLGMTQRQVDQQFAEELGESSKYIRFIQQFFGTPNQQGSRP